MPSFRNSSRPAWGFPPALPAAVRQFRSAIVLGSLASAVSSSPEVVPTVILSIPGTTFIGLYPPHCFQQYIVVWRLLRRLRYRPCCTPFRSDDNPIPFVDYLPDGDGALRSRADHSYGYAEALADGVVRPVVFLAYSGTSSWRTSAGEEITARLGEPMTAEQTARAWRTALDPGGEWIPAVLAAADRRLTAHRDGGMPDAGGLVIASDQTTARAYAAILADVTGTPPAVVLSDEPGASARIARFSELRRPVDGRGPDGERGRGRAAPRGRRLRHQRVDAAVLRPGRRPVRAVAAAGGDGVGVRAVGAGAAGAGQRAGGAARPRAGQAAPGRRAVGRRAARGRAAPQDEPGEDEKSFTALGAHAELDQLIYEGTSFSADEEDYLGLPGLLEPDQVRTLLNQRQKEWMTRPGRSARRAPPPPAPAAPPSAPPLSVREQIHALRKELNTLVALHHHRTNKPHGAIHNELRAHCGGPAHGHGDDRAARGAHRHPPLLALSRPGGSCGRRRAGTTAVPAPSVALVVGRRTGLGQLPVWTSTSISRSLSACALAWWPQNSSSPP